MRGPVVDEISVSERAELERQTRVLLSTIEAQRAVTAAAHDRDQALRVVAEQVMGTFPAATGAAVELLSGDVAGAGSLTGVRSVCVAPLHSGDTPVGVIRVVSGADGAFDEVDARHLELLAASLTAALLHVDDYARNATLLAERTAALEALELSVTAQRAADARLHQQAALLKLIPAAVIVRRIDGTILWWNNGAQQLYGWTSEAARGRRTHRLFSTVFESGSATEQQAALEGDGHWDGQMQHLTASGRVVTVLSRQVVHRPADGDVEVLEINTDVTAARAAEQALAVNEQRFRAQFTHSAVGQVIRALDGSLIAVNKAFARMLGRRVEDMAGRVMDAELLDAGDLAYAHNEIAGLFAGDAAFYTHETRLRHADGHWVDVEATVSLVRDSQDRPRHLIVVATDISQRRIAERARDHAAAALAERNTALEVANQLKLDIIGMLGHEISNPLSAILGYSDLLADDVEADSPAATAVTVISRQAQRLDEIVREVLSMVSIDAGNLSAVRGEVSLHAGITSALESTGNSHVPVTGPDVTLRFNPGHLQQVLVNLLANAAEYAGGATAVRIGTAAGGRVLLSVEDRGPGVPEEFRPRLFDRLTRAGRDAGSVRGTGLGLYIVRSLARANHGEVRHESHPAGGSIFTLEAESV
ncbi:PAS domain-containing sensor histidine kinase [Actinoplanes sp. NPDC026670]|uniref:sensor histidine kinase n=1 Tax=Actinoplanes sp. NPDC026670 TaxID=3154700 RepID=UPI00340DD24A